MSNFFINTKLNSVERFDFGKFMEFTDNYDPLTSRFLLNLRKLPVAGQYVIRAEEKRPELLSFRVYANTQYWWVLLFYNALLDDQDLETGQVIQYPALTDLEDLFFSLKANQRAVQR